MKPIYVGGLVLAGALVGGLVMWQVGKGPVTPSPVAVTAPAPAPATPAAPAAVEPEKPAAEPLPSSFPEKNQARRKGPAARKSRPAEVARNQPPEVPVPPAASPAPQTPAPPQEQPKETPQPPAVVKSEPVAPPAPEPPHKITIKAGTLLPVRVVDGLSTERNQPGDSFTATLTEPLVIDGFVIAERGARLEGRVVRSDPGGRVKGVSSIAIELTKLNTSDGQHIAIQTEAFEKLGQKSTGQDAAKVGAAAGIGAAIGAIAGGGKGAAIGAAVGGAAGTGGVIATRGKAATIPTETKISFRLRESVTLTERRS